MNNRAVTHLLLQWQPSAHGWRCAGTAPARCLADLIAADEAVSGDWRIRGWRLSRAIRHQPRGACLSPRTTCGAPLSELLDAGADLTRVQKIVDHEGVTTTGYD